MDHYLDLFPPKPPFTKGFALKNLTSTAQRALSVITENQFWSRLSAPLHPMITKIMKK